MDSLSPVQIAYCGVVLLVSYLLRGSTGFGQAVGLPLLALVLPIKVLAPAWNLLGIISSIAILGPDRRHVARRDFALFLPWCLAGVGIGLYFFKTLDPKVLSQTLGAVVLVYAAYSFLLSVRPLMADAAPPKASHMKNRPIKVPNRMPGHRLLGLIAAPFSFLLVWRRQRA